MNLLLRILAFLGALVALLVTSGAPRNSEPAPPTEAARVQSLWLYRASDVRPTEYCFARALETGACSLCADGGEPMAIDAEYMERVDQIVADYAISEWNGFSGSRPYVLDGEMFSLEIVMAEGEEIHASGNNSFPEHYLDVVGALDELIGELGCAPGAQ